MRSFDEEIEKAVDRAGKAAGWLFALAVLTLLLGVLGSIWGMAYAMLVALPGAGLLFGVAILVNVAGMHLMESWRQGRIARDAADEE
jgi:hypothetical protein